MQTKPPFPACAFFNLMALEFQQDRSSLTADEITQKTYKCDLWRGGFEGVLSSGAQPSVCL